MEAPRAELPYDEPPLPRYAIISRFTPPSLLMPITDIFRLPPPPP